VFEATQAAIVHPGAVEANRNAFVQLVISNLFGQNAPLIAAAEGVYEEMWAADVAAMAGYYSGASAVAAQVVPWQSVLQNSLGVANLAGSLGGLGSGVSGASNVGSGSRGDANVGSSNAGSENAGGGANNSAGDGSNAAGGGGANNVGSGTYANNNLGSQNAGPGLAPGDSNYANGNLGNHDIGSGSTTSANTGYASQGVGGFGMVPIPIGGGNVTRAGLLGDNQIGLGGLNSGTANTGSSTRAPETPASSTPEVTTPAPQMAVLPTSVPEAAPKAAPVSVTRATVTTGSGIRESTLRASGTGTTPTRPATTQDEQASETSTDEAEKAVPLRSEMATGKLRPRAKEGPGIQMRGG
jgi:PPE-repeat protein